MTNWIQRVCSAFRSADGEELHAHIRHLDDTCDSVQHASLPGVGGTAHVVQVVRGGHLHKTVGRSRAEAYRKMVEHLAEHE